MKKPKIKRGKQHRTKFMEKHYIALLKKHGRLTVKQLFQMTCECEFTARRRLVKLKNDGKINGEIIGNSWEFWTG